MQQQFNRILTHLQLVEITNELFKATESYMLLQPFPKIVRLIIIMHSLPCYVYCNY